MKDFEVSVDEREAASPEYAALVVAMVKREVCKDCAGFVWLKGWLWCPTCRTWQKH